MTGLSFAPMLRFRQALCFCCLVLTCQLLLASPCLSASVQLSWDAVTDSRVAGYKIYYGLKGTDYSSKADLTITDPNQTNTTITGLAEGSEYLFAATSFDGNGGESNFSDPLPYKVPSSQSTRLLAFGDIALNHQWTKVELPSGFSDPVVVAGPMSHNGPDPAVVRIRNVTPSSFEIRLQEYDYLDGTHTVETVSYLAMESGSHILSDGTTVEAGRLTTSDTDSAFTTVDFAGQFTLAPVVMTSVDTCHEAQAVVTRNSNVSTKGFEVQMQEQEASDQVHGAESIGYVAWEPSRGEVNGFMFEVGQAHNDITHQPHTLAFQSQFLVAPSFVAGQQTRHGSDTANLRCTEKSRSEVCFFVDEEQSGNEEVTHTTESVGFIALAEQPQDTDGDGLSDFEETEIYGTDPTVADTDGDGIEDLIELNYWADDWDEDIDGDQLINILDKDADGDGISDADELIQGTDPADPNDASLRPTMAFGDVPVNHHWTEVELPSGFTNPVVVAGPLSLNGYDPAVVRIRNVTPSSFEIRLQEYDYLDGSHTVETVSYLAMDTGRFELSDGTEVEAGRTFTSATHTAFGSVAFSARFDQAPVVLASINSFNDVFAAATRMKNITSSGFDLQMQMQEASDQVHGAESIGYIAWEPSSGICDGVAFEAGTTPDQVTDAPFSLDYNTSFFTLPAFLAGQQTRDGSNPANLRLLDKSRTRARFLVDEESSATEEVGHTTEEVGYLCLVSTDLDPFGDPDQDGLNNNYEIGVYGTDPYVPDTDGDLLLDGDELDVWGADWDRDPDADGTINLLDADADNDGVMDGVEVQHGSDPGDKTSLPQETVVFGDTPGADHPGTIQDTFLNLNSQAYATATMLNTYTWPANTVANAIIITPDLSQLPQGAEIQSATLQLYQTAAGGDGSYDVSVHKVVNHNPNISRASGFSYDGISEWSANNQCYNSVPLAQADIGPAVDVNSLDQTLGLKAWDVTQLVQDWLASPESNKGMLLNSDDQANADSYRFFASSEAADGSRRPRLEITYTITGE